MYPAPTAPPARTGRPATVTTAVALLLATILLNFGFLGMGLYSTANDITQQTKYYSDPAARQEFGPNALDDAIRFIRLEQAFLSIIILMLVFATIVLALFDLRGRRGARIGTWIFCGVLTVIGFGAVARAVTLAHSSDPIVSLSGGALALVLAVAGAEFLLNLAIVVLLVLPPSREFFHRPRFAPRVPGPYQVPR